MTDRTTTLLTENADDLMRYFRWRVGDHDAPDLLAGTLITDAGIQRRNRLAERVRTVLASTDPAPRPATAGRFLPSEG